MILGEDDQSANDILLSLLIDDMLVNKVIYLYIYMEPFFKFSIQTIVIKIEHFINF